MFRSPSAKAVWRAFDWKEVEKMWQISRRSRTHARPEATDIIPDMIS